MKQSKLCTFLIIDLVLTAAISASTAASAADTAEPEVNSASVKTADATLNTESDKAPYPPALEPLLGEWGTDTQCARDLLTPKGTKYAAPFELKPGWLGHDDLWCRMNWSYVRETADGVDALAYALCGEDTVRDYQIRVVLTGDQLNLTWNFFHSNGPLTRCAIKPSQ